MNRRDFLNRLTAAAFAFTVLPPAETYERVWRAVKPPIRAEDRKLCGTLTFLWDGEDFIALPYVGRAFDGKGMIDCRVIYDKREDGLWARLEPKAA